MNKDYEELQKQVNALLKLLAKMAGQHQGLTHESLAASEGQAINLNLCFLTVLAGDAEQLEQQMHEWMNQTLSPREHGDASFKLTASDVEFLKRHGMTFE